ncbi:MAG: septum formation protein Maf [Firmicutes bacterium]|nr:septum formation protein Maf [Bacillota bacterium]
MYEVVLASQSVGRKWIFELLGLPFKVIPSGIDENAFSGLPPHRLVEELSLAKAREVASEMRDRKRLVVGADTVVVTNDGEIMGKPADEREAREMLLQLQGRSHYVMSGVAVVLSDTMEFRVAHDKTEVKMRRISPEIIEGYIRSGEPLGKAGAYAIQGKGALLVEGICGCYFNVVGLPLAKFAELTQDLGIDLMDL